MTTKALPQLDVRVRLHKDVSGHKVKLLAFAELAIAGAFVIKSIRILQGEDLEPFVVFPAEKGKGASTDRWYDIAHPCTPAARVAAVKAILGAYDLAKPCKCGSDHCRPKETPCPEAKP